MEKSETPYLDILNAANNVMSLRKKHLSPEPSKPILVEVKNASYKYEEIRNDESQSVRFILTSFGTIKYDDEIIFGAGITEEKLESIRKRIIDYVLFYFLDRK